MSTVIFYKLLYQCPTLSILFCLFCCRYHQEEAIAQGIDKPAQEINHYQLISTICSQISRDEEEVLNSLLQSIEDDISPQELAEIESLVLGMISMPEAEKARFCSLN